MVSGYKIYYFVGPPIFWFWVAPADEANARAMGGVPVTEEEMPEWAVISGVYVAFAAAPVAPTPTPTPTPAPTPTEGLSVAAYIARLEIDLKAANAQISALRSEVSDLKEQLARSQAVLVTFQGQYDTYYKLYNALLANTDAAVAGRVGKLVTDNELLKAQVADLTAKLAVKAALTTAPTGVELEDVLTTYIYNLSRFLSKMAG